MRECVGCRRATSRLYHFYSELFGEWYTASICQGCFDARTMRGEGLLLWEYEVEE